MIVNSSAGRPPRVSDDPRQARTWLSRLTGRHVNRDDRTSGQKDISAQMLAIRLDGDHSRYHCGSAAAFAVIREEAARHGRIVADNHDFDILVMNGEGTMHHGGSGAKGKIARMERALAGGKRVALVNSVWQDNPVGWLDILHACESIVVREVLSQRALADAGILATVSPDQSYFAEIDESAPFEDFGGAPVFTDFWSKEFGGFVSLNSKWSRNYRQIDMTTMSWSSLVRSLRTASVLVTGRHHAIYAACRAEIPFLAMRGNCHKIEGLVASAGSDIPVYDDFAAVREAVDNATYPMDGFLALVNWLRAQPPWRLF